VDSGNSVIFETRIGLQDKKRLLWDTTTLEGILSYKWVNWDKSGGQIGIDLKLDNSAQTFEIGPVFRYRFR